MKYRLEEIATLSILTLLNTAIVLFADFGKAGSIFLFNLLLIMTIPVMSWWHRAYGGKFLTFVRDWYVLPFLVMIYMENARLIPLINPNDMDGLLIILDRYLFLGNDPTVMLGKMSSPPLTEILQIVYASFYFLPLTLCVMAYRQDRDTFHIIASVILIGFYISFIGYYLTPALGPRFTIQHDHPLTGVFSFNVIRSTLDSLEGVMRDCCPSGHAMISVLTVLLAYRYKKSFFGPALVWTVLLFFSAVYLRYHYVVDLIAGLVMAGIYFLFIPAFPESKPPGTT